MISTIQTVLNTEIPLTNAIGIEVDECTGNTIKISAPLESNINHKNTAFGGSLYSVSVLAGWSLIYALLKKNNLQGHIVIQESNIQYLTPVTSRIVAECRFVDELQINRFLKQYKRKGVARIKLTSIIKQGVKDAVVFNGSYVVHL